MVFSKVCERATYNKVYSFVESFDLLHKKQFGFQKKHSTVDAIAEITEKLRENNYQSHHMITLFLDLSKTFDCIDHAILKKLDFIGIRGPCKEWMSSYLKDRMQLVSCNGVYSNRKPNNCGTPQGSVLGPLLFLLYVNNLPLVCKTSEVFQFADDTNVTTIKCSHEELTADIESVSNWLDINKIKLKIKKTQVNISLGSVSSSPLVLNGVEVKIENSCRYLGVIIDNLSFKQHVNCIINKLSRQCGILSKLRHYVPRLLLLQYYQMNIEPIIQYGILECGCTSYTALVPIEDIQKNYAYNSFYIIQRERFQDNARN